MTAVDAYRCPGCGYFERDRPPGGASDHTHCPRCLTRSVLLGTPSAFARRHPELVRRTA
ncbi:hypothetical protein [Actinomycetospora termitidis]|uniref:Uncharacterized protein n=1 Tax=Actinomycetospora termitidis TaxID=3053470 RepID=A0ABT7MC68_9PSEU|nr:hypothetical protein [Actinomycetospora sp. Odt1-22]MDL5158265.1 hypothetical protein [Actinomycetospora sp. Odt1-22]